jgi:protocatechuate 3,4-dioxygenase, alpha subunit
MLKQTPSQTVGPFFGFSLVLGGENILTDDLTQGQRIIVRGQVFDGDGIPINDAMIEIWQADHQGILNHPDDPRYADVDKHFRGFGRAGTNNKQLLYSFKTVKPGPVPWDGGQSQAPHINMHVFARGMLVHATTRLYFPDEPASESDPVLGSIGQVELRRTLIARLEDGEDLPTYRLDIHLQGEGETVFFDA